MKKMSVDPVQYGLGLGLGIVAWHAGAGSLVVRLFLERGVVALYLYSLGEVRYEELSVLVNVKSKPTIVSAGFQKNLAGCIRPGPFCCLV